MEKVTQYGLDFYKSKQDIFEPDELFYTRIWFIFKNGIPNDILEKKSRIMINQKYLSCNYLSEKHFTIS